MMQTNCKIDSFKQFSKSWIVMKRDYFLLLKFEIWEEVCKTSLVMPK